MTSQTRFSGDELARHPQWKCLTSAKFYKKSGRRKYQLQGPDGKSVPPVYITKEGVLYYTFAKVELRTMLPPTYQKFLITLKNHNLFVVAMMTKPPMVLGGDGETGDLRMSLN